MQTTITELEKAIRKEANNELKESLEIADKDLKKALQRERKTYQGTEEQQKHKIKSWILKKSEERTKEELNQLKSILECDLSDFPNPLIITLEWKKSYMWGLNPRSSTNYGFEGTSIGGCGYCKTSTATAEALNSYKPLMKMLYLRKEKELKKFLKDNPDKNNKNNFNREVLGYGSGYSILPHFEGGVGVSSHQNIIEGLGLEWKNITFTDHTNVYMISKVKEEVKE